MRYLHCLVLVTLAACGPAAQSSPPPPAPGVGVAPTSGAEVGDAVFVVDEELEREDLPASMPELPLALRPVTPAPKGLGKAPPRCSEYTKRTGSASPGACGNREEALRELAEALRNTDTAARDAKLAGLESCGELPVGMVRAVRAELADDVCADTIVGTLGNEPPAGMNGAVQDALVGLRLAGMLSRAATHPPEMKGKATKDTVSAFLKTQMRSWIEEQAKAIQDLARVGSKLRYYGKAIVAVEAGMADMRFVEASRSVPVPEEFEKDEDLRETYLQSLEQTLEPRKLRGRDAALVGLGSLATVGVLRDARVDRARALLSRMFGGRPINALDELLLPPLAPAESDSAEGVLAARLQTFYAGLVIGPEAATDPKLLRMLIEKGLSLPHRIALRQAGGLSDDVRRLAARARLELGQNYWRRVDFDEAVGLLADHGKPLGDDVKLMLALAIALRGGHANAAEMMVQAPISDLRIGRVDALDAVARGGGPHAGEAELDAALIKQLAAPASAPAAYWQDLAQRYRKAHGMLDDVRHQRIAEARAKEAEQTAAAVAEMK